MYYAHRSKQGLEDWRNQAKLKQRMKEKMFADAGENSYVKAVEVAPFATDSVEGSAVSLRPDRTVQEAVPGNRTLKLKLDIDKQIVHKYRTKLEEKRQQVGIITKPSSELQEAEQSLAEVSR